MERETSRSESAPGLGTSIEKALDVLFVLHREGSPCGVSAIGRALGLPKSSVHRLLAALASRGLVTDESAMPEVPASVPSGLPVVEQVANPAREVVKLANVAVTESGVPAHEPTIVRMGPNDTIQQAVDLLVQAIRSKAPMGSITKRWCSIGAMSN